MISGLKTLIEIPSFYFFVGLIGVFLLSLAYWKKTKDRKGFISKILHNKWASVLMPGYQGRWMKLKIMFFFASILASFLLYLRPFWGEKTIDLQQNSRNVLFALDISRSMLANDISAAGGNLSRLEFAKLKIRNLIEELGPERVGLVLFADNAFLQCPFTKDPKNFFSFLDQIDATVVSSSAETSIMQPIKKAIEVFTKFQVGSKILVLFSDGEDFGKESLPVLDQAKKEGIALCSVGLGSDYGAPVPIIDPLGRIIGHEQDSSGKVILTKLDRNNLQKITKVLGGEYYDGVFSDGDIRGIKSFVERFEKELFDDAPVTLKNEVYPIFAALGAVCLVGEALCA